ncbi:DUF418 domain-containing protein [Paenibacillus chibensis]|uniref:DUF418 domain-containing protein n=1 Tax=Paenibacillus chibensis TaxID=59846 RepID=UPI000FDA1B53|nr:DUF418 domain-containing protein [Paenibacillus chibensis]MEC0370375.1 DUF418 domain-containing protein [Paenibacillus chibensis]
MKRIDILDYLRGFALVGILFINILQMIPYVPIPPQMGFWSVMERKLLLFIDMAVYGRFFTIFSFLFGAGFYLFISRAKTRGDRAYILFARRLMILMIFGFVHHHFQPGEALLPYAILGFLLLPLYKLKPWINFLIALLLLLTYFWTGSIGMILSMFVLGLWAGQSRIFETVAFHRKRWIAVQTVSLLLIPAGLWAQLEIMDLTGMPDLAMTVGGLAEDVFYVSTLTLLLQFPFIQKWLMPLNRLGRMALTHYMVQTIIILTLDKVLGLSHQAYYLILAMLAIEILMVQVLFSIMWLNRFPLGPLEWIWRVGTYGRTPDHYRSTNASGSA